MHAEGGGGGGGTTNVETVLAWDSKVLSILKGGGGGRRGLSGHDIFLPFLLGAAINCLFLLFLPVFLNQPCLIKG